MITKKELRGPSRFNPTENSILAYVSIFFVSMQHCTLIPFALLIGRFNLCRLSIIHTSINCFKKRQAMMDVVGMSIHWMLFSLLMFCTFDNNLDRFFYFAAFRYNLLMYQILTRVGHFFQNRIRLSLEVYKLALHWNVLPFSSRRSKLELR